jgi:hypothetical protein
MGVILHSRFTATAIVNHIASEMRKTIVQYLVSSSVKIAVLVDESTTLSKVAVMTVHIKADMGNGEPIFIFLDLVELEGQGAEALTNALLQCLKSSGFTEKYLHENWIAFVRHGASVLMGKKSGVAQRLCEQYPRNLLLALS